MSNYILSCCSTADLTKEHFAARQIKCIFYHFIIDGEQYPDDLGQTMPFEEFYAKIAAGAQPTTAQVNTAEFIAFFEPFLKEGKDILHVSLSSGLSGTYSAACIAKEELAAKYPDRKLYVVDSLGASSGYGLLMDTLADKRDQGVSIDEAYAWALQDRLKIHHWFFSTDLTSYIRGGRISKAAGHIGTVLNICPLLNMDAQGLLTPREKIRTKKRVTQAIVEKMKEFADGGTDYNGKCYISQSACYEDARAVADLVESSFPHLDGKVEINYVGTVIGSHTGPGTIALFFFGSVRD
jgi:DegV family protein with EDD domain